MAQVQRLFGPPDDIAIVGWSCRLPGANSVAELWRLLAAGRCAVSSVPPDRFPLQRYGHPRPQERGKSYTWAAGIIDDVWGFDPTPFGISPREAEQMDPQQRLLLELTWEALEDAGIPPSSIAGTDVGVFVGASQTDYAHTVFGDHAIADAYFATGNALAILANRISYIFDLRGPSLTLDTACSSSLVALHQASEALRGGRVETAIVGGVNVIASPAEFISFSQASMLSPTGLCHAFSADADGYVRSEGGVVLLLRKRSHAAADANPIHGLILTSDVNSDGRTNGISLPSADAQAALLDRVYARAGIDPDTLAFVEAHGTGTPVGDPIEAEALGRTLGRARGTALPIGSIKSNIGHTEAASGLAGVLKAVLALHHGVLPRSLHCAQLNPAIPFDQLNLAVCAKPLALRDPARNRAGVNSFGFGGTNAHVVVAAGDAGEAKADWRPAAGKGGFFALSAATKPALIAAAQHYAGHLAGRSDRDTAMVAAAVAHRRDHLENRLVISTTARRQVIEALNAFVSGAEDPRVASGTTIGDRLPIGFVYSGNGSQWVGMGVAAYRHNAVFRTQFDAVDQCFKPLSGWSLKDALFDENLAARFDRTSVAQPLIFAIQSAATAALRRQGVRPSATLGHSVGEVAAAEAAGALDLRSAVEVIYFRSKHQELVRDKGRMAAVLASEEEAASLLGDVPGVEIAAVNSPRAITVAGSAEALAALKKVAASRSMPLLDLDLDYPFHTVAMMPIKTALIEDLRGLAPRETAVPFISTVTGATLPGGELGAAYWWRNVRETVQFQAGIREATRLGIRFFVEIGPRSMLLRHITDSLPAEHEECAALSAIDRGDHDRDPIEKVVSKALVSGARLDIAEIFGTDPGPGVVLPTYPWQQRKFRYAPTSEAATTELERHPLAGTRDHRDALTWHAHIDTALFPALADHKVGDQVLFPGTGFLEIAFAVAREWLDGKPVLLTDYEIRNPLDLTNGETREVMTRVSPDSNTIEIFSRPRLSQAGWLLNVRCKVFHGGGRPPVPRPFGRTAARTFSSDALYRIGDACGLHYGPAFRLVRTASVDECGIVEVELSPGGAAEHFLLDPIRADACCHGLLTTFPGLRAEERGVSYIPVRVDESALFIPGAAPCRAFIEVSNQNERSVTADYTFLGPRGETIAQLRGVYCQAVPVKRTPTLEATAFIETPEAIDGRILGESGSPATASALIEAARAAGLLAPTTAPGDETGLLIEGYAVAAAYAIAAAIADDAALDVDALVASNRLSTELAGWLGAVLASLEAAGLARRAGRRWSLIADPLLPSPASIVEELARKYPACAAEIMAGAAIGSAIEQIAAHQALLLPEHGLSPTVLDFYDAASVSLRAAGDTVMRVLDGDAIWPADRALRVLVLGHGPLTGALEALRRRRRMDLAVVEPDHRCFDAAARTAAAAGIPVLGNLQDTVSAGPFDLLLSAEGLSRFASSRIQLGDLLAPGGLLIAVEPLPSLFLDLLAGLDPNRTALDRGRPRRTQDWPAMLQTEGFTSVEALPLDCGHASATLIVARTGTTTVVASARRRFAMVLCSPDEADGQLGAALVEQLRGNELDAALAHTADFSEPSPDTLVHLLGSVSGQQPEPMHRLTARCLEIKACVERFGSTPATIWHVHRGALAGETGRVDPVAAGNWAFSRTVANEFPHLDIRRVDIDPGLPPAVAAARLREIVSSGTVETELQVTAGSIRAVRIERIKSVIEGLPRTAVPAVRLQRRVASSQRFHWEAAERTPPAPNEVEIAVETTGLNFRDLMWILSLLSDDILEDGATGPALGCECAGTVLRVGTAVEGIVTGDRVAAFAPAAFASHVTVPAAHAIKLPAGMSFEAGATIPVAFLTAYYSLVVQARLAAGEWVLIHGGAGGVGMAAIQLARSRGARIIATAGSPAKRELLTMLGVEHALDSRSTHFVDEVRAITRSGVDVVLNSLAGEAMERGIACLRAFGRFIEIGKRDYIANTPIGLRPFRKNLAYFGVDIDQLMAQHSELGRETLARLMRELEDGTLTPLPHTVFKAEELSEAFHLMQHSGHIGKIVVRAPALDMVGTPNRPFAVNTAGTHVITGGFGGLGLETARWLVERGARHLVLLGRGGGASDEGKAALANFAAQGVQVHAEPCDIADRRAAERAFEQIARTMPPIVGVVHAAMVLDDGLIANLDRDRFLRVMAPKIRGADILDELTRGMPLDYFVLFSSSTTLVGNPGQGNYVAANAYLEGIARRRRQEGLKALAIGWGPITDVGVLARSGRLRARFQKMTGIRGMRAREAVDLMARALEQPPAAGLAVMTISPTEGLFTADRLPVLASPTYARLVSGSQSDAERTPRGIDLHELARTEGLDRVRHTLTDIIVTQLARILHAREDEIPRVRPLGEIGVDSLMAIEVAMNLEEAAGFHMALTSSLGNLTVTGLANEMIAQLGVAVAEDDSSVAKSLAERHTESAAPYQLAAIEEIAGEQRREAHS